MQKYDKNKKDHAKKYLRISYAVASRLLFSLLSENKRIDKRYFKKIYDYVSYYDAEDYKDDNEHYNCVYLLKEITKSRVELGMSDLELIFDRIISNSQDTRIEQLIVELEDEYIEDPMNDEEIEYLSNLVTLQMRYRQLLEDATEVSAMAQRLVIEDYDDLEAIMTDYSNLIKAQNSTVMKYQLASGYENEEFDLLSDDFNDNLQDTLNDISDEGSIIRTGLQALNIALDGGFKRQDVICFFGPPAMWKSGMLYNICIWAIKYNKLEPKDKTKKPTVLYVSFENSKKRTIGRQVSYLFDDSKEPKDVTAEEVIDAQEKDGWYRYEGNNFVFKYRPTLSVNANGLEEMILKESEENNNEVVMLVVDYLRRLAPNNPYGNSDEYISLGDKSDDLSNLAKKLDIPIVTGSQMNRGADEIIEKGQAEGTKDAGRKIGRGKISESRRILDNIDGGWSIVKEFSEKDGIFFMTFNNLKIRGKVSKKYSNYFVHPFEINNGMRLVEDVELDKIVSQDGIGNDTNTGTTLGKKINKVGKVGKTTSSSALSRINDSIDDTLSEDDEEIVDE